jgi:Fe2+ or Zn2+ uptake regulation protein
MKIRRTKHQIEVMGIILREAGNGVLLGPAEIYRLVSYKDEVTYGAIRKTIEILEKQGMVKRCRNTPNSMKVEVTPTLLGYDWFRPKY